ncbi:MAG: hypothetical protein LBL34_04995 [Clostridiales bacterium]|jgi:hypothetical protein|nr:hypothetical protein [Clostridiales bacterium]
MTQEISIYLRPDISYLAATVNGVATEFNYVGANMWRATVPKSADNTYHVFITAYNSLGLSSVFNEILTFGWVTGITDRTLTDALFAKRNPNMPGLKGARNASDLNRVGSNMIILQNLLLQYGYVISIQPKTDWLKSDVPRMADIQSILNQIDILRETFTVLATTPDTPEIPINLYSKMNDIERILEDMYLLINNMIAGFIYSGEIYSGEDDFN